MLFKMAAFWLPSAVSLAALGAVWWWGGMSALLLAAALAVLEVTLSFDNSVINAKVLGEMPPSWQQRFITWGMFISVFGTRLVLPVLIVSAVSLVQPFAVAMLALTDRAAYASLLVGAETTIKAFGGSFLLMVSLKYFFNAGKRVHWFSPLERRLVRWGRVEAIEIALALFALLCVSYLGGGDMYAILQSGIIGIVLFTATEGVAHGLGVETAGPARTGLMLFIYINVLDAAFSLDGVIGAFALTTLLPIIVVGLGIGAYFVRALTLYLVRAKTLAGLPYLEHGAHYAVLGLAVAMLAGLIIPIPQFVVACIGLGFIALSYLSSRNAAPLAQP